MTTLDRFDRAERAIKTLDLPTADDVADLLRSKHIKHGGGPNTQTCPIAVYLQNEVGMPLDSPEWYDRLSVSPSQVTVSDRTRSENFVLPDSVIYFIRDFDKRRKYQDFRTVSQRVDAWISDKKVKRRDARHLKSLRRSEAKK